MKKQLIVALICALATAHLYSFDENDVMGDRYYHPVYQKKAELQRMYNDREKNVSNIYNAGRNPSDWNKRQLSESREILRNGYRHEIDNMLREEYRGVYQDSTVNLYIEMRNTIKSLILDFHEKNIAPNLDGVII